MDPQKTGELIRQFRIEKNMTQKQLAERLLVSDKAVSKWECGNGCPDISLFTELARVLGTDAQTLLSGELEKNESEKGDMRKLKFFICRECGNIITAASEAAVTCCGTRLSAAEPRPAEESESLCTEEIDGEWYITSSHPMTKDHYISFVAYVSDSTVMMFRQYPEWNLQARIPLCRSGKLFWYCTQHGLMFRKI